MSGEHKNAAGGDLHEISRVIGNMEAELRGLNRHAEEDRRVAYSRHKENSMKLEKIEGRVGSIETQIGPLTTAVDAMKPIVDGYVATRWKIIGGLAVLASILSLIGWAIATAAGKLIGAIFTH
jgi:hypothetical protein